MPLSAVLVDDLAHTIRDAILAVPFQSQLFLDEDRLELHISHERVVIGLLQRATPR